jgi:integrase
LGPDKKEALRKWHELSRGDKSPRITSDSLVGIFELFMSWVEKQRPASYDWYNDRLSNFGRHLKAQGLAAIAVSSLKVLHVQAWVDTKRSPGHRRGCCIAVNRALNWAVKQGHIPKNPILGMEKPAAGKREVIVPVETYEKMLALSKGQQFKDLLVFTWETGARPQESTRLEKRHVDFQNARCIFSESESKGKKKRRVVYLTETATEILRRLCVAYPEGPLFRNEDGKGWHRNNISCRFQRMRETLGAKYCLYHLRHTWMTRLLTSGVDPITVATLAGHSDTSMLARIYAHIQNDTAHLQNALKKITGEGASSGEKRPSLAAKKPRTRKSRGIPESEPPKT